MELKGGKSINYRSRLTIVLGGLLKASVKKLTAVSKGLTYNYGIQTKARVIKNQLPSPFNVTYEGEFVCTGTGIIGAGKDEVEEYRNEHMKDILKKLNQLAQNNGRSETFDTSDISFTETEEETDIN